MEPKSSLKSSTPINIKNVELAAYKPTNNDYAFIDISIPTEITLPITSVDFIFYLDDVNYKINPTNSLKILVSASSADTIVASNKQLIINYPGSTLYFNRSQATKSWTISNIRISENTDLVTRPELRNHENKIATSGDYAHVKISDSVSLVSNNTAGSSTAIKTAWDKIINVESRLNSIGGDIGNRRINTLYPVYGGGQLNTDLTIGVNSADYTQRGVVQIGDGLGVNNGIANVNYGNTANTACQGNDGRLYDKREPREHASNTNIYGAANGTQFGHVRLSNDTTSTDAQAAASILTVSKINTDLDAAIQVINTVNSNLQNLTIYATPPLFGGGKLTDKLNLSVAYADENSPGIVVYSHDFRNMNAPKDEVASIWAVAQVYDNSSRDGYRINAILDTTINTTEPLRGGGDLSANRTLTIDTTTKTQKGVVQIGNGLDVSNGITNVIYGNAVNTACQGNDARLKNITTQNTAPTGGVNGDIWIQWIQG